MDTINDVRKCLSNAFFPNFSPYGKNRANRRKELGKNNRGIHNFKKKALMLIYGAHRCILFNQYIYSIDGTIKVIEQTKWISKKKRK